MTKHEVFQTVLRDVISDDMAFEDVLLVGLVLHTHSILLREGVEIDDVRRDPESPGFSLAPLTRTHIAQMLSMLWPSGDERGREGYWFVHYGQTVGYEVFDDVPDILRDRALAIRDRVAAHELIERLVEE